MKGKAQLIIKFTGTHESMMYQCSLCGQTFPLNEERSAKQAMMELRAAFLEHVRETHPQEVA
jgi:hypothetical protein